MEGKIPRELTNDPAVRLTSLWKIMSVALVLLAAAIYGVLVIDEIFRRTDLGTQRRERNEASRAFVEDEALLGTIWAHQHRPYDATWCPDYSASFHKGCAAAVAGRWIPKGGVRK